MSLSKFFKTDKFNLQQIVTPCIGTKTTLLLFRLVSMAILFYGFLVSIYNYHYNYRTDDLRLYLPYFTNQVFIAILIYFSDRKNALPPRFKSEELNILIHIFYNALVPLAFLVSLIFWGVIYPTLDFSRCTYLNYAKHFILHCFQSFAMGMDWFLTSLPTARSHVLPMLLVGVVYLLYTHIYHVLYGKWIYKFVDTSKEHWVMTYTLVFSFWIALGYVFTLIHEKKNEVIQAKYGNQKGNHKE